MADQDPMDPSHGEVPRETTYDYPKAVAGTRRPGPSAAAGTMQGEGLRALDFLREPRMPNETATVRLEKAVEALAWFTNAQCELQRDMLKLHESGIARAEAADQRLAQVQDAQLKAARLSEAVDHLDRIERVLRGVSDFGHRLPATLVRDVNEVLAALRG